MQKRYTIQEGNAVTNKRRDRSAMLLSASCFATFAETWCVEIFGVACLVVMKQERHCLLWPNVFEMSDTPKGRKP